MNELSERIREISEKITGFLIDDLTETEEAWLHGVIEQALLAERRLAMEEAAKICMEGFNKYSNTASIAYRHSKELAQVLRAAAEKEVANG